MQDNPPAQGVQRCSASGCEWVQPTSCGAVTPTVYIVILFLFLVSDIGTKIVIGYIIHVFFYENQQPAALQGWRWFLRAYLGKAKPSAYDLPPENFSYGKRVVYNPEPINKRRHRLTQSPTAGTSATNNRWLEALDAKTS